MSIRIATRSIAWGALLILCGGALASGADALEQRFVPHSDTTDELPESSVPESFKEGEQPVELVSVPASEAESPRATNQDRTLEVVNPADLANRLDADRLLLSEIRKQVPESRSEAEGYLRRLKRLAGMSDPVRLVPLADRVLDHSTIYFDWLDREFDSQEEQVTEYYVGGARGFSFALENFKTAVMFTIMNRLEIASRVISEAIVE